MLLAAGASNAGLNGASYDTTGAAGVFPRISSGVIAAPALTNVGAVVSWSLEVIIYLSVAARLRQTE
jgi:hypothetical protein